MTQTLTPEAIPAEKAQAIFDAPAVNAALCSFYEDATNDNAFFLVRDIMESCRASILAQPASQGYKLVPIEPTSQFIAPFIKHCCENEAWVRQAWREMLAAAPEGGK